MDSVKQEVPTALFLASQTKDHHHKAAGLGVTLDAGSSSGGRHRPARRWAPARPVLRTIDDAGRLLPWAPGRLKRVGWRISVLHTRVANLSWLMRHFNGAG